MWYISENKGRVIVVVEVRATGVTLVASVDNMVTFLISQEEVEHIIDTHFNEYLDAMDNISYRDAASNEIKSVIYHSFKYVITCKSMVSYSKYRDITVEFTLTVHPDHVEYAKAFLQEFTGNMQAWYNEYRDFINLMHIYACRKKD